MSNMSLEYTPDRRAELEENIKGVLDEMPGEVGLWTILIFYWLIRVVKAGDNTSMTHRK